MAKYIDKIGIEVECAIQKVDGNYPRVEKFNHTHDGSVNSRTNGYYGREYVSKPVNYKADWDNKDMSQLEAGLYQLYKTHGIHVNDSMGLHVHVSFYDEFFYHALASEKFRDYFMDKVANSELFDKNPRLRERFDGVNYAEPVNSDDLQASLSGRAGGSRRYRHFIYRPGMETIEFRLFPAFDSMNDVKQAIGIITEAVNGFLFNKKYELEESEVLKLQEDDIKFKEDENQDKEQVMEVFENV